MSKITSTDKIPATDFPDQKSWIDKLLRILNQFMQDTVLILNGGIQLSENLVQQDYSIELLSDGARTTATTQFRWTRKVPPTVVLIAQLVETGSASVPATGFTWSYEAGQVICTISGLSAAKSYTLKIKGIS